MKTVSIVRISILATLFAQGAFSQLGAPGESGVAMGHIHLNISDTAAQRAFWTGILGGAPLKSTAIDGVSVPGAFILFKSSAPTGPTAGSTVDHIGFFVSDLAPYAGRLDAAHFKYTHDLKTSQLMIAGPDGVKVELTLDASMTTPIRFHHIHFHTPDPIAIQTWYWEKFGAKPGKRAIWEAGDLPGTNLTYAKAEGAVPTAGRAVDHIGFEVKDLESFCKRLEGAGVKFDTRYRKLAQGLALAFLTDPWGTRIELTEGLEGFAGR